MKVKITLLMLFVMGLGALYSCSKDETTSEPEESNTVTVKYEVDTDGNPFFVTFLDTNNLKHLVFVDSDHWEYSFETDSEVVYVQATPHIVSATIFEIKIYSNGNLIEDETFTATAGCGAALGVGKTR